MMEAYGQGVIGKHQQYPYFFQVYCYQLKEDDHNIHQICLFLIEHHDLLN